MTLTTSLFKTRARTIDHLGREQIADTPTAISELWKNAYDAYAKKVELHIFDGEPAIAALVDDGHGMTIDDVNNKWLTVGTESKATLAETPLEDRNGLPLRVKQGQKGIGRLSCAALGSLMLLVSKKKNEPFVACLLDWRLFENPFLMLHDIKIPTIEFMTRNELLPLLPSMFDSLMGNLWGDKTDPTRDSRVIEAWNLFHEQEKAQRIEKDDDEKLSTTKEAIENTAIDTFFTDKHLNTWDAFNGKASQGTAMFIGAIHEDLIAQLSSESTSEGSGPEIRAKERIIQTLNNFVNPFTKDDEHRISDFTPSVTAWNGSMQRIIIDPIRDFNLDSFYQLEHIIEGNVDEMGKFTGRIKAFNEWYEDIEIKPKSRYKTRSDSRFGPFKIRLGTFEAVKNSSKLSDELWAKINEARNNLGGTMVYRDNLRVMPYGREDNDYFEMEYRRSKNAGRYVFSNRACFGGVQISKEHNPNLRDKAGREGIIDNRASKLFKEVVEHILIQVAFRFIGRESELRAPKIEEARAIKEAEKNENDRKKVLKNERNRIKKSIASNSPKLSHTFNHLTELSQLFAQGIESKDQEELTSLKLQLNELDKDVKSYSLSPIPSSLGSLEQDYREYRNTENEAKALLKGMTSSVIQALDALTQKDDVDIAEKDFKSKAGILHAKINKLAKQGREAINQELTRFNEIVEESNKAFYRKASVYLDDLAAKRTPLDKVLSAVEEEYELHDIKVSQELTPYIKALASLAEQIDLESLAVTSVNENAQLRKRVDQVNSLAQLGITVEIIGHEIEGLDMTIERGLKALSNSELSKTQELSLNNTIQAHQSLSDSWRFLSPLKLSGEKVRTELTGNDIFNYITRFFGERIERNNIKLIQSNEFKNISLYEQPSKLYPVFINLINNARYWVKETTEQERIIKLDVKENIVYVSDNGPGVDQDDIERLFTIFFTKKQRGGRGVGLYLCKQNISSNGDNIFYETREDKKILSGANFAIEFKGIKHAG